MQELFTNKNCMYFGALVGEYYFCMIQCTDMEHIKFIALIIGQLEQNINAGMNVFSNSYLARKV
jgi:hypothetical protein